MFTVKIEVFIINKRGIKIAVLADSIVLAVDAFEAGSYNRLLEAEFTSEVIMRAQSIG